MSARPFPVGGLLAEVRLPSRPDRVWRGTVYYVYRLDNPGRTLQPNMFATVPLGTQPKAGVLAVPLGAVIRTGQGERVVLALGDGLAAGPGMIRTENARLNGWVFADNAGG